MAHVLHVTEWESSGKYLVSDVTDLPANSGKWWHIANLLSLKPAEYVKLLIEKFNAVNIRYILEKDVLVFYFSTLGEARKFKNFVNKQARDKNFVICT